MFLIDKSGTRKVCREHRVAFKGKCPDCEALKRASDEAYAAMLRVREAQGQSISNSIREARRAAL